MKKRRTSTAANNSVAPSLPSTADIGLQMQHLPLLTSEIQPADDDDRRTSSLQTSVSSETQTVTDDSLKQEELKSEINSNSVNSCRELEPAVHHSSSLPQLVANALERIDFFRGFCWILRLLTDAALTSWCVVFFCTLLCLCYSNVLSMSVSYFKPPPL